MKKEMREKLADVAVNEDIGIMSSVLGVFAINKKGLVQAIIDTGIDPDDFLAGIEDRKKFLKAIEDLHAPIRMKKKIEQYLQERVEKGAVYMGYTITSIALDHQTVTYTDSGDYYGYRSIYDILYNPDSNFWEVIECPPIEAAPGRYICDKEANAKYHKKFSVTHKGGPIDYLESIERPE